LQHLEQRHRAAARALRVMHKAGRVLDALLDAAFRRHARDLITGFIAQDRELLLYIRLDPNRRHHPAPFERMFEYSTAFHTAT
jgi:hypothetical protein